MVLATSVVRLLILFTIICVSASMAGDIKQNANMRIIDYLGHAINIMYPPICIMCKANCWISNILCKECWGKISFITRPTCKKCGTSLTISSNIFKLRKLLKNWLTYISATLECKDIDYIFPVPLHKSKL